MVVLTTTMSLQQRDFVPSSDAFTSIVVPTIVLCIAMVVGMIVGIYKCKQWELDKIVELRRSRRVIQRITARLREKNFRTIQRARCMRKKAYESKRRPTDIAAPPVYFTGASAENCGASPPPAYEDALLEQLYRECLPPKRRTSSAKHAK